MVRFVVHFTIKVITMGTFKNTQFKNYISIPNTVI